MNRQEERKMTVTIAGKKKEIAEKTTIAQIIVSENVENPDYVTVTVNDEFVDSDAFATTELKDGDTVEFLYFMGGGSFYWHSQMNRWNVTHVTLSFRKLA